MEIQASESRFQTPKSSLTSEIISRVNLTLFFLVKFSVRYVSTLDRAKKNPFILWLYNLLNSGTHQVSILIHCGNCLLYSLTHPSLQLCNNSFIPFYNYSPFQPYINSTICRFIRTFTHPPDFQPFIHSLTHPFNHSSSIHLYNPFL